MLSTVEVLFMDMQPALFTPVLEHRSEGRLKSITLHGKERYVSPVFTAYWRFAAERQAIFHRRLNGAFPFTADPILQRFKFTNAYRILDRTTQYLIREVLNHGDQSSEEVCFRVLLFKLFNKIETWELLARTLGQVCCRISFRTLRQNSRRSSCERETNLFRRLHHAVRRIPRREQEAPFAFEAS